jgi:putative glycosyltransferase (TIGR04372 family)
MNFVKRLVKLVLLVGSLVVLAIMKMIQPFVRFQLCIVGFHRYGHLALEPEICLAEQEVSRANRKFTRPVVNLWSLGPTAKQSNKYLARKWSERLTVVPSWMVSALHDAGEFFPLLKLVEPRLSITGSKNGLDKTEPHLSFSKNEIAAGERGLLEIGIDPRRPYVCLVVRDGGHYKSKGDIETSGYELINFNINDFASAAAVLIAHGYQVIRMGSGSEQPFTDAPEGVIDYASLKNRSEFLDVYLAATCAFAISTQTGPDAVCMLFRRPVLYVDVTRYGQFFFGSKIATWTPVRLLKDGRILNLSDVVGSEIAWFKDPNLFAANGISQQKSTEGELRDLVALYIENRELPSSEVSRTQEIVARGMGERGRRQFGDVTAMLLPHAEQVLGEWVLK